MGAELLVEAQVIALGDQMDVELAEDRWEAIGVVDLDPLAAGLEPQPMGERRVRGQLDHEQAVAMRPRQLRDHVAIAGIEHPDPIGLGLEGADHDPAAAVGVQAEEVERIAVVAPDQGLDRGRIGVDGGGPRGGHRHPFPGSPAG